MIRSSALTALTALATLPLLAACSRPPDPDTERPVEPQSAVQADAGRPHGPVLFAVAGDA